MSNPIFISYSSKDASLANKLVSYVEEHGYKCWIAPRDITSGEDYTDLINNAIKSCIAVIIIVSDKSIRSQWVKKELTTAVSYNKKLIPFKIQNVVLDGGLEFILNNVQWIDASSNMTSHFPDIIEGLRYVQPANPTMTVAQSTSRNKGKNNMIMWGSIAAAAVIAILLVVVAPWSKKGEPQEEPVVEVASDTTTLEKNEIEENVTPTVPIQETAKKNEVKKGKETTKEEALKKDQKTKNEELSKKEQKTKNEETSKRDTVETKVKETPAPVVETQPTSTPTVTPSPTPTTQTTTKTTTKAAANDSAYKRRRNNAMIAQRNGRYKDAIELYQKLLKENPEDKELIKKIDECRASLNNQNQ